jgi:hypothetical protein
VNINSATVDELTYDSGHSSLHLQNNSFTEENVSLLTTDS